MEDEILKEVYQVMKKKQRAPPPGGYMFSKNDHVTTKMGRLPPSPCKCCGSNNHWDRECPDWAIYLEKTSKSSYQNERECSQDDELYQSAYSILLSQRVASMQVDETKLESDFKSAIRVEFGNQTDVECKTRDAFVGHAKVSIEEVEDEYCALERDKPKSPTHLLIHIDEEERLPDVPDKHDRPSPTKHPTWKPKVVIEEIEDESWRIHQAKPKSAKHLLEEVHANNDEDSADEEHISANVGQKRKEESYAEGNSFVDTETTADIPPPPNIDKPIRLSKKRITPPGLSALGVSVLSTKGWVGNLDNPKIDLRLDSCADVTLISAEFYASLRNVPKEQQGMRMKLWQLTDKDSTLKGFVRIPIIMETEDGILLESEAEAYIVPGMTVPILLGEDYQLNYELGVTRNVESGTRIHFEGASYSVPAYNVNRTKDFDRMRQSALVAGHFIKSKIHRRNKAKRHRRKIKFGMEQKLVRAAVDVRLRPHECRKVKVEGQFEEDKDWLVQKTLLANANDSYFAVPNTLISARNPWVPIANPTDQPRYIRRGEIIGVLEDPAEYFETPANAEREATLAKHASAIADIIRVQLEGDSSGDKKSKDSESVRPDDDLNAADEEYGPKTAAMPDLTDYPSEKMEQLIDVGSLPDHLKEQAWDMLRKRQKAFGFDGRLGHLPTKVHIRTADGQVPIAVPMYGSSPEKRRVMDEQIDKWFEQGVIEPSISPWSAPVVIAYRNGKPRFCVDYRRLNAVTTPDEFPIPRQSEILSSLSGAQVLSSLDALSGFTQLELDPDDIEKTAFRTHRGLFQFRRMPFGL